MSGRVKSRRRRSIRLAQNNYSESEPRSIYPLKIDDDALAEIVAKNDRDSKNNAGVRIQRTVCSPPENDSTSFQPQPPENDSTSFQPQPPENDSTDENTTIQRQEIQPKRYRTTFLSAVTTIIIVTTFLTSLVFCEAVIDTWFLLWGGGDYFE